MNRVCTIFFNSRGDESSRLGSRNYAKMMDIPGIVERGFRNGGYFVFVYNIRGCGRGVDSSRLGIWRKCWIFRGMRNEGANVGYSFEELELWMRCDKSTSVRRGWIIRGMWTVDYSRILQYYPRKC